MAQWSARKFIKFIFKKKNDESRYGDVTNLSVFSILHALMFWDPFSRLFLLFPFLSVFSSFSGFSVFFGFSGFFQFFLFFSIFSVFSGVSRFFSGTRLRRYEIQGEKDFRPLPLGPVPKNSFRGTGPWVISYRSSHKRARSANPMESSSTTDRRTKCGHKRIENTLKTYWGFLASQSNCCWTY